MLIPRATLSRPVSWTGKGLHSGEPVSVNVFPGNDGIAFRSGADRYPAIPENVTDTSRCTRLGSISTVEHLMSAFAGLEITDAEVEVTGGELPALDGSALAYVQPLNVAGIEHLESRDAPDLFTRVFLQEDNGLKIAVGKGSGHWRYVYDLGHRWPYKQEFEAGLVTADYERQIAPARTLVLAEELEMAQRAGLGKGLDDTSCLILDESDYRQVPRFPDEPARHKLLDLIGDLYLSGVPIAMLNVVAEKSGHRSNVKVAQMLVQALTPS